MRPTEELMHEHEVITLVLGAAAAEAGRILDTRAAHPGIVEQMLDFFRNFTDRCHHAKEEKHLFPLLESKGMPHGGGLIASLLSDHEEGRALLSAVSEALPEAVRGDAAAVRIVSNSLGSYVRLLEEHIDKENEVLFPMAERMLSSEDGARLEAAFAEVEEQETGAGVHEKYHRLAHEIASAAGVD
ncbi:MAG TPA: hemerythrin domain-containing protein [Deltaproteobacteria bacterium]|nr:hemerythrin domain-containing protein [Deltaproteobacteria bacterium]HOI05731.1 hemerythrin domain-containing protein [Deltaproteobacteria bacterium]